jgi:hypothetical protein
MSAVEQPSVSLTLLNARTLSDLQRLVDLAEVIGLPLERTRVKSFVNQIELTAYVAVLGQDEEGA